MPVAEYKGNLFNSSAQTLVNTVNCVGVMGKGVALEFRLRFPQMFEAYRKVCEEERLRPGQILPYRTGHPWILSFAVKNDWKHPSRMEWVESCLKAFVAKYRELGISSIAFPWIGAMNGGLPWEEVHALMCSYLNPLEDVAIEIVEFDPDAPDPIFLRIREAVQSTRPVEFAALAGITRRAAELVMQAIHDQEIPSLARLCASPGLGKTTVERLYAAFGTETPKSAVVQRTLFDEHAS